MNSAPRKEDPRLLIAFAAAIVGLALWHLASGIHVQPHAVLGRLRSLIPIALGALAIAAAPATHRIR